MIRDLTKSAFSFGWAMSIFGMKQMAEVFVPGKACEAAHAFQPVTEAAVDTFGNALRGAFQAGDALQRGAIDIMADVMSGKGINLSQFFSPEAKQQAETAAQQAAEAASAGTTDQGWGPVPST